MENISQQVRSYSDFDFNAVGSVEIVKKENPTWIIKSINSGEDYCYDNSINSHRGYMKLVVLWESISLPVIPFKEWSD